MPRSSPQGGDVDDWVAQLQRGSAESAWDAFVTQYRGIMFASVRHCVRDHDDVMDAFARVCEALRENDFARLRRCAERLDPARPFAPLLAVVVRNLTIDWLRHRDGRSRLSAIAEALPALQQRIFVYVFVDQRSHVEAFELLKTRDGAQISFPEFRHELLATYRAAGTKRGGGVMAQLSAEPVEAGSEPADPAALAERCAILDEVLETLSPEDRVAVQLYVVEGMPADQVARALGHAGAKTVYNRVYRALAMLRERLERIGIRGGDL